MISNNGNLQNSDMNEDYDEIDLAELLHKLFDNWKSILKWAVVGAVVGIIVAVSIPRRYEAVSICAPERTKSSSGNLGTLASIAGISLANLSTTDAITPELYPSIISSVPFLINVFSTPVEFSYKGEMVSTDIYSYFKDYTRIPWWDYVIKAPIRAVGWIVRLIKNNPEPVEGYDNIDSFHLTKEQYKIAKAISKSISVNVDKKTYIVTIKTSAQNSVVSARMCQSVCDNLKKYVDEYQLDKANKDLEYYEKLYEQSQKEYYEIQQEYAAYTDANQGIVTNKRRTEHDRLQNETTLKYNLYNSCAQQVQQAKARIQLETPEFAVISPATVPLKPSKPSKKVVVAAIILLFIACDCVWILSRDSVKSFFSKAEDMQ